MLVGRKTFQVVLAIIAVGWSLPAYATAGGGGTTQAQYQQLLQTQTQAQSTYNTLLSQQQQATGALASAQTALTNAQTNYSNALATGTASQQQLAALQASVTTAQNLVTSQQANLTTITNAIPAAQTALTNAQQAVTQATGNLTTAQQQQNTQLTQQQQNAQNTANTAQNNLNAQNSNLNAAQNAYNTAVGQQTTANNALTAAQSQLAALQASGSATPAQLTAAQNAVTQAQAAVTSANTAVNTANTNLTNAQQQQQAAATANTAAQQAAATANAAVSNFTSGLVAQRLAAGNAIQNAVIGGQLAAGNATQNANLGAYNLAMNTIRNANTAANVAARQGQNAAFAGAVRGSATVGGCTTGTLGGMLCNIMATSTSGVGIITGFAYIAGLICGFLGILKLRQHVESPSQIEIWDPIKRFIAGGAFFAFPHVVTAVKRTIEDTGTVYGTDTNYNGASSGVGLDAMIVALMRNLSEPAVWIVGWFGWIAGLIFVFIGISRLMQTEREGPRGPTGIGTVMTFLIAGCLFSLNSIVTYLNGSVFNTNVIATHGTLQYTAGLGGAADHIHAVISAIIAFSIILGWISLVRGLFIVRGVSEGNSQASMMAGITHLIGGILAINLGSVVMAVQTTLGITDYGIVFAGAP